MTIKRLRIQFERENINFKIKRFSCSIILVNQVDKLEPCL